MNDLHPRTLARRPLLRPFDIIIMQGVIYKVRKHWSKAGKPTMQAPTRATIRDIFDAAAIEGERPRELIARLRGADRQWQLDHTTEIPAGGAWEPYRSTSFQAV